MTNKNCGLVLIDDTGSPGQQAGTPLLDPHRKSWVAVVVSRDQVHTIERQLPGFLAEFQSITGLKELHCTDLYNGKGCRNVPLATRLGILGALADIFMQTDLKVIVQTVSGYTIRDIERSGQRWPETYGPFRFRDPAWLALYMVLCRAKWHLKSVAQSARFVIDEGLRGPGSTLDPLILREVSPDGLLHFMSSARFEPLQLADFAAFAVNRMQWIMAKQRISGTDEELAGLLQPLASQMINLPSREADLSNWTPQDYNDLINRDRILKDLPPIRPSETLDESDGQN